MNMTAPLNTEIANALKAAERSTGWNMRPRDVRRFELGACVLLVVPFACWRYRRRDQIVAAWRSGQAHA